MKESRLLETTTTATTTKQTNLNTKWYLLQNNQNTCMPLLHSHDDCNCLDFDHDVVEEVLKGSRMGHSVGVSLWCVALLINTRFRFFILE